MRYADQVPPRRVVPAEQVDEAPGQIEKDQVDVERAIPVEHDQSIERNEHRDESGPSITED